MQHMLGKAVDVIDMEAIDPDYYKSLVWILENSIDDVLELSFSTEMDEFGQVCSLERHGMEIDDLSFLCSKKSLI